MRRGGAHREIWTVVETLHVTACSDVQLPSCSSWPLFCQWWLLYMAVSELNCSNSEEKTHKGKDDGDHWDMFLTDKQAAVSSYCHTEIEGKGVALQIKQRKWYKCKHKTDSEGLFFFFSVQYRAPYQHHSMPRGHWAGHSAHTLHNTASPQERFWTSMRCFHTKNLSIFL